MRPTIGKFGAALGALVFISAVPVLQAQTLTGVERRVTTAAADQFDPAISGNLVVYTDFSGVDADVWYTDTSTGIAHPVVTTPGDQQLTGVSGNRVVFTDWNTMDVFVFDVATGAAVNLTNAAMSNSLDPAIGGDLVAWTDDRDGNAEIYARNLATGEERRITNDPLVDESPAVGDGIIVWECCDGYECDVFAYEWSTKATRQLTATDYVSERFPDVSGRTIVYQREFGTPIDKDVAAFDLDAGIERHLDLPGDQENAHVSGDIVVFNDSADPFAVPHIGLWQLGSGAYFHVTAGPAGQYLNDVDGRRIVYSDNRHGDLEIYAYDFEIEDPVADTQPPAIAGAVDRIADATSPAGADVSFLVSAIDDRDPSPVVSCAPPSGSTFPIGATSVTCTASDASGNMAAASFAVTVRGPDAQLAGLADLVSALNLRRGIENSLDAKLNAAVAALAAARAGAVAAACQQLGAFINEVSAQAGKSITVADAAMLIAAAGGIRAALGCG